MEKKFLLFDLDGVLFDSYDLWDQVVEQLLQLYGAVYSHELKAKLWSVSMEAANDLLLKEISQDISEEEFEEQKQKFLIKAYKEVPLFESVKQVLESLKEQDFSLLALTANYSHLALAGLESHDLLKYFEAFYSTFDFDKEEKDRELLSLICQKSACKPEQMMMVEDSLANLREAKKLGITTVYIKNDLYPSSPADYSYLDYQIAAISQLPLLFS